MERRIKECIICGKTFVQRVERQLTCGRKDCVRERTNEKRRERRRINKHIIAPTITNRPTGKKWERLTPCERWLLMSWEEITAECARYHISYGQAQVMHQCRQLPEDFGRSVNNG